MELKIVQSQWLWYHDRRQYWYEEKMKNSKALLMMGIVIAWYYETTRSTHPYIGVLYNDKLAK